MVSTLSVVEAHRGIPVSSWSWNWPYFGHCGFSDIFVLCFCMLILGLFIHRNQVSALCWCQASWPIFYSNISCELSIKLILTERLCHLSNGCMSVYKGRLSKNPYYKWQLFSSQRCDSRGVMSLCLPPYPVLRSSTMSCWPFVMPASNWKRTTSLESLILWCRNAIIPAFFVLTRMSEWVRDQGNHPILFLSPFS